MAKGLLGLVDGTLTGYEAIEPMVADGKLTMASPWRSEERQIQGVFHGLYVFSCLSIFFIRIGGLLEEASSSYVNLHKLASRLTSIAKHLVSRWSGEALTHH
jgi:hypothetical protein